MTYHIRKTAALVLLLAVIGFPFKANSADIAKEDRFNNARLVIQKELERSRGPSISVAAAQGGKIIWEESFGWADIEKKIKATPNTAYSLASISKPITATGLMVLVEKGLIDLDKPADDYLGTSKLRAFQGRAEDATVKRLLHHTAGLPTHWHFFYDDAPYQRPSMEESILRYGILTAPPGLVYNYSNFGYGILEYIIERVSGQSYPEFIRKKVFEPLGMLDSAVYVKSGPEDRTALRYMGQDSPIPFYDFDHRGASAVYCSANDLVRFGMFHLNTLQTNGSPVLKAATITRMQTEGDHKVPDSNYKMGWAGFEEYGYKFISHSGGMPGVRTVLRLIPGENMVFVVLANGNNVNINRIVQNIIAALLPDYAERMRTQPSPSSKRNRPRETPAGFLGTWRGEIITHEGPVPMELSFEPNAKVSCRLTGKGHEDIKPKLVMGIFTLSEDFFSGAFAINLATVDAARFPHQLMLTLKRLDNTLVGDAAARAYNSRFNLPAYIKLEKQD